MATEAEGASGTEGATTVGGSDPEGATEGMSFEDAAAQAESPGEPTTDNQFTIETVNGPEMVTLDELQKGYMRQADYTRKTQAAAEAAKRVEVLDRFESQLDSDPEGTLRELAAAYGVNLDGTPLGGDADDDDDGEPLSPEAKAIQELNEWKRQMEQRVASDEDARLMAQVDSELEALKVDNEDPDLDENAVLEIAVNENVGNLQAAYLLYRSRNPKQEQSAAKPPPVEGGSNTTAPQPGTSKKMTLTEAMELAEQQLAN